MPNPIEKIIYQDQYIKTEIESINGRLVRQTDNIRTTATNAAGELINKLPVNPAINFDEGARLLGDFQLPVDNLALSPIRSVNDNLNTTNRKKLNAQQTKKTNANRGLVGQFIQHAATIGYQHSNRYVVIINGPAIGTRLDWTGSRPTTNRNDYIRFGNSGTRTYLPPSYQRRLALTCQDASLAAKALLTEEYNPVGNGPNTVHAYGENYTNDLSLTFLCSTDFFERMYFQNWMDKIVNSGTHEVAMYEDYASPWSITIAVIPGYYNSGDDSGATLDDISSRISSGVPSDIYFIRYDHVYPYRINDQAINYSTTNDILKLQVQFRYHRWYDPVVRYMRERQYRRSLIEGLPTIQRIQNYGTEYPNDSVSAPPRAASLIPVEATNTINYRPIEDSIQNVDVSAPELSPFDRFRKVAKDIARYSNPQEFKKLISNAGIDYLGGVFGEGNVESVAQGGQIIDVYVKTPNKDIMNTSGKLIGPLGNLL